MLATATGPEDQADRLAGVEPAALPHRMTPPPSSEDAADDALFERIRSGSTEAFAAFYDRHSRLLYAVALRILGDTHEAEDVLQDAAVLLWEKAPVYNPAFGRPLSWAVTLTRNRAIDRVRARKRKTDLHEAAGADRSRESGLSEDASVELAAVESAGTVQSALQGLPSDQRRAIELAFFSGMTQTEIATALGVPLGTIKARIRRGLLALRELMDAPL